MKYLIDTNWSSLADSSFIKDWENKKDAVYDNWEEKYKVPSKQKKKQ